MNGELDLSLRNRSHCPQVITPILKEAIWTYTVAGHPHAAQYVRVGTIITGEIAWIINRTKGQTDVTCLL
jgi:hypothetical protein